MAQTIIFDDALAQQVPSVVPNGQSVVFTDATAGKITLDAVNRILEAIGEMPVTTLDDGGNTLADDAKRILFETTDETQADENWACNTAIKQRTFSPGTDGRISMADILQFNSAPHEGGRYALRDGYLFDRQLQTDTFAGTVDLYQVVERLQFHQFPEPIRRYNVTKAAVRFANTKQGDAMQIQYLRQVMQEAFMAARRFDGDQRQTNLLDGSDALAVRGSLILPR